MTRARVPRALKREPFGYLWMVGLLATCYYLVSASAKWQDLKNSDFFSVYLWKTVKMNWQMGLLGFKRWNFCKKNFKKIQNNYLLLHYVTWLYLKSVLLSVNLNVVDVFVNLVSNTAFFDNGIIFSTVYVNNGFMCSFRHFLLLVLLPKKYIYLFIKYYSNSPFF